MTDETTPAVPEPAATPDAAPTTADTTTATPPEQELTRPVFVCHNDDGTFTAQSVTSSPDFKIRAECLIPSRLIVPIIFLPGIMGTRLRTERQPKTSVWFPPEGIWEKLMAAKQNLGRKGADRQRLLDPNNTEVDDSGMARPSPETEHLLGDAPGETEAERSKWRGWGQLHAESYGAILETLEQRLAAILRDGTNTERHWQAAVMGDWQDKDKLGAQKEFSPLDTAALKNAASVFYPVHAVGYNWLKSNQVSAERVAEQIERILAHYTTRKKVAEKVILVTHSMGGLVARACFQLPGMQDKIMGIVHGVMPATGAPLFYKRMRSGAEGIASVIFGRDAAEVAAVAANAPGPLELLPTPEYRSLNAGTPQHWLRANYPLSEQQSSNPLGDAADPYTSIYFNQSSWYRLVREELIDPAGREDRDKEAAQAQMDGKKAVEENEKRSDFAKYTEVMTKAKDLQDSIKEKYHPNTYAYYAADAEEPSWNQVNWQAKSPFPGDVGTAEMADDDLNGKIKLKTTTGTVAFDVQSSKGPGDGTVPAESGAAPTAFVKQIFRHEGKAKGHTSYDHQLSYNADVARAATLYSIARMVADSDWLKANLHKA